MSNGKKICPQTQMKPYGVNNVFMSSSYASQFTSENSPYLERLKR